MIEILNEESLEEREKRKLTEKQQADLQKTEKKKEGRKRERESLLPKNIRQVGDAGENTKVYFEDYVMTYIKQQAAFGKEGQDVLIFYGDKRRIYGKTYYFVSGAIKIEEVNSCLHPILFEQEQWKRINEMASEFFSNSTILGWALLCEEEELELKTRVLETHEEYFGEDRPVFMEYIKSEKEEKVYLYQMAAMQPQMGHYIYYDKNEKMQNYMIHEKENEERVEEESIDHAARQFRMVVQEKQEQKRRKRTNLLLYSTAVVLAIVVMLIGITLLGNYEKMENMEKVLYEMADSTTENKVNTIEEKLNAVERAEEPAKAQLSQETSQTDMDNAMTASTTYDVVEANKSIALSELTGDGANAGEADTNQTMALQQETQSAQPQETQSAQPQETQTEQSQETQQDVQAQPETTGEQNGENNANLNGETGQEEKTTPANEQTTEQATSQESTAATEENQQQAAQTTADYQIYEIKKGDTLEKINRLFYGNKNRIKEICELNQIENQDNICYGEKIILPW